MTDQQVCHIYVHKEGWPNKSRVEFYVNSDDLQRLDKAVADALSGASKIKAMLYYAGIEAIKSVLHIPNVKTPSQLVMHLFNSEKMDDVVITINPAHDGTPIIGVASAPKQDQIPVLKHVPMELDEAHT